MLEISISRLYLKLSCKNTKHSRTKVLALIKANFVLFLNLAVRVFSRPCNEAPNSHILIKIVLSKAIAGENVAAKSSGSVSLQ